MEQFIAFWQQVNIKDFFDIAIVSILIYQGIMIVHGTRAVQMLIGVAFIGLLFTIGIVFKLYSLNWILSQFFESFFIIFVILFQDQIRTALASFGSRQQVFGGFKKGEENIEIDEVVEACADLSREKIGALIVFERIHGLKNYMDAGTRIDSKVGTDIIRTIFLPSSPLHDGAIIISGGKIAAAGCFLPLSSNFNIDRHLGTRHRAALGLSEMTDAIIVIVSEETGQMTVCLEGVFYHVDGENYLRRYLKHLGSDGKLSDISPRTSENVL